MPMPASISAENEFCDNEKRTDSVPLKPSITTYASPAPNPLSQYPTQLPPQPPGITHEHGYNVHGYNVTTMAPSQSNCAKPLPALLHHQSYVGAAGTAAAAQTSAQPPPLKELELHDTMISGTNGTFQTTPIFGPQIAAFPQEIVDLEVAPGMEMTLPNPDGTNHTYRGPVRISMPISPGMSLPIAPPMGYQVVMRYDQDQNTGQMVKVYSVLPQFQILPLSIQNVSHDAPPQYIVEGYHPYPENSDKDPSILAKSPPISKGGETDEEKKNIKNSLSQVDPPILLKSGSTFAVLQWSRCRLDEVEVDEEKISYILEIRSSAQKTAQGNWQIYYQGLKTEYECSDLRPENSYLARVKARYLNIEGDPSQSTSFQTDPSSHNPETPRDSSPESNRSTKLRSKGDYSDSKPRRSRIAAPENLKAKKTASSTIDVSWSPVTGSTKYILQMKQITHRYHDDESFKVTYEGIENSYTVRELKKAARYRFRVAALMKDGQSDFSRHVDESTGQDPPTQPSKPVRNRLEKTQVATDGKGRASPLYNVTLDWKAPKETGGSPITEFRVQQRYASQNQSLWELKYKGTDTSHVFSDLLPGSKIEFRVQAVNQSGINSAWSLPELLNTPPGRPLAPKRIDVSAIGTDSCSLSWSVGLCVAGGSVSRYEVRLTEVGYYDHKTESAPVEADDKDERVQFKDGLKSAREATLENLLSGRTYKVHLRTVNSGGEESEWNSTEFQTLANVPVVPESPSVTSVQSDAVAIEWREPVANGSPITGYYVQIRSEGKTQSINVNSTKLERSNLAANTHFVFKVSAINSVGQSAFSSPCSVKTNASIPHVPKLSVSLMPNSTPIVRQWVLLQWPRPQDQGSKITSYTIETKSSSGERSATVVFGDDDKVEIDDLLPEESYRFRIRAVNDRGHSPWSDWIHVKTKPLPPSAPMLQVLEIQPTSIKLQWTDSDNKYMLQRHTKGSWKVIYRGEKNYNKISKLSEGTQYQFRVSASNSSGDGPFSAICEVTTPRCPPPNIRRQPLVHPDVESRSVTVAWTVDNSMADLKYRIDLLRGDQILRTLTTAKTELKIENLDTNVIYYVRVQAQRDGQWADYSPEKQFSLVLREVKEVKETTKPSSMKKLWEDDSITALLVFAFAIVAVLIALCGHHWQTS